MTTPNRYRHSAVLGLVAVLGLALAGCAAQGPAPGSSTHSASGDTLGDNLNGFLSQSPAGAIINLAESPWGSDVEVIADERYFAASGRECRQLRIVDGEGRNTRRAVACDTGSGWETRRLVTESTVTGGVR